MKTRTETRTAQQIRAMARKHHVVYTPEPNDELAHHITRLAADVVQPDEIEELLFALQRAGHLARVEMVRWQARYLREIR